MGGWRGRDGLPLAGCPRLPTRKGPRRPVLGDTQTTVNRPRLGARDRGRAPNVGAAAAPRAGPRAWQQAWGPLGATPRPKQCPGARRPGQSRSASRCRSGRRPPPRAATPRRHAQTCCARPGAPRRARAPRPAAPRLTSGRRLRDARCVPAAPGPSREERSSRLSRSRRNNGAPGRGRLRRLCPSASQAPARARTSSGRRGAAAAIRHRAGALAPPARLRPAPGGARARGPPPDQWGGSCAEGAGQGETKGGGAGLPGRGCGGCTIRSPIWRIPARSSPFALRIHSAGAAHPKPRTQVCRAGLLYGRGD